jgi:hypothetical protein
MRHIIIIIIIIKTAPSRLDGKGYFELLKTHILFSDVRLNLKWIEIKIAFNSLSSHSTDNLICIEVLCMYFSSSYQRLLFSSACVYVIFLWSRPVFWIDLLQVS